MLYVLSLYYSFTLDLSQKAEKRYILFFQIYIGVKFFRASRWLRGKESACNAGDAGDVGFIPGLGRSPGEGNGNPLHYSCLENSMDRGA